MRVRRRMRVAACFLGVIGALLLAGPGSAVAQVVQVTPEFSIEPTTETTPWVIQMAIGAAALGVLVLLGIGAGYMRFAPKFYGRQESEKPLPGARPPQLVRQAAAVRWTPPAPGQAPPAPEVKAEAAPEVTASGAGEPAAPADAVGQAETAAPEAQPTAKAPEAEEQPAAEAAPAEAPGEGAAAAEAPAAAAPAAAAPTPSGAAALDQETFDRVLKEQLEKGVDRRVAEGRARAAAVVAARRKAQG